MTWVLQLSVAPVRATQPGSGWCLETGASDLSSNPHPNPNKSLRRKRGKYYYRLRDHHPQARLSLCLGFPGCKTGLVTALLRTLQWGEDQQRVRAPRSLTVLVMDEVECSHHPVHTSVRRCVPRFLRSRDRWEPPTMEKARGAGARLDRGAGAEIRWAGLRQTPPPARQLRPGFSKSARPRWARRA